MAAKDKKNTPKAPHAAADSDCSDATGKEASERFVRDLEVRGEAAKPSASGKLPLDATHAVVEENPDGSVKQVKRARFKAF
jgi:hypothetical protein